MSQIISISCLLTKKSEIIGGLFALGCSVAIGDIGTISASTHSLWSETKECFFTSDTEALEEPTLELYNYEAILAH